MITITRSIARSDSGSSGGRSREIKSHTDCLLATDFFTTDVWIAFGLVTYYCLFFIHVGTRKVYVSGITRNPTNDWMKHAARNLTSGGCDPIAQCRYLISRSRCLVLQRLRHDSQKRGHRADALAAAEPESECLR